MGLLGQGWDDPQSSAIMALAGGLLQGNFGGGLLGANNAYQEAKGGLLKQKLAQSQLEQAQMSTDEMRRKLADDDATRKVLQGIYSNNGLPQSPQGLPTQGGAPSFGGMPQGAPQVGAPAGQPGLPGAQPTVTPKAQEWQQYKMIGDQLAAKGLVQQAQQYYGLADKMRPKYGTEPRVVMGPDGKLVNVIIAEDGSTQVLPFGVKPAIKMQDLGGKVVAVDENTLGNGQAFNKTQTPDSLASNAVTMRGQNMTDARARETNSLALSKPFEVTGPEGTPILVQQDKQGGITPVPGFQPKGMGATKLTEAQGNATAFASRMADAARIVERLQPTVSPAQVAQAGYKPEFPSWMPGGQILGAGISAANKAITPEDAQLYRQAQENWVTANLRKESGAAISKDEMNKDIAKWFPQPNEPQALIEQKAASRKVAERAMAVQAGPGASQIQDIVDGTHTAPKTRGAQPTATMRWNPKTQRVEMVGQ